MHTNQALIATDPTPAIPALGAGSLAEWGLMGTLVFLTFQKGWEFFSKKEDAESALVKQLIEGLQANQQKQSGADSGLANRLIEGLRENQTQMLSQTLRTAERSHDDIKELKEAIVSLNTTIRSQLDEQRQEFAAFRRILEQQNRVLSNLRSLGNQGHRDVS